MATTTQEERPFSCLRSGVVSLAAPMTVINLMKKRNMLTRESAALDAMSPLKVLGRGYAIATDAEGRTVRSVRALENGQRLRLRLSDGQADCLVEHAEVEECRTRN